MLSQSRIGGNSHSTVFIIVAWLLSSSALAAETNEQQPAESAADKKRPNIVVVLADDLGYGDLACYGHPLIETPNLDRFADEGLRLTSCYSASAVCSPARAGLMTGRTPYRNGIHNWIPFLSPMHLQKREITVATLLNRAGYDTCHVGKWHLNGRFNLPEQPQPFDHGFRHWFSTQNNALPSHHNPDNFVRNGQAVGELEGYSAQLVVDEGIRWLTDWRDRDRPFFLFVCFHEPHEPIATDPKFSRRYASEGPPSLAAHYGNVTQMDDAFGRLMNALDDSGLRDETLVFFTSDNGPAITRQHPHGSPGPLREKKGHMYEGGIRVPGIIRWPGAVEAGNESDEPICGVDLLPTLCDITDVPVPTDRPIDGASIVPVFRSEPVERTTPLYWQYNYARSAPRVALRMGDWKLLATLTDPLKPGGDITQAAVETIPTAELKEFELYNLKDDIGETTELSKQETERFEQMTAVMRQMYREVREESPQWPAWEWPRLESQRIRAHLKARSESSRSK